MSEKISPSLSEVLGDQQYSHPVHDNMPPPRLASQVGLKVPPRISASTVEGNSGTSAARLPELSESLYSQNAMWNQATDSLIQIGPSADTEVIGRLDGSPSSFPAFSTLNFLPVTSISLPYGIVYPVLWKNGEYNFGT
ncbi:uncharacterized protein LOC115687893 isoform X1 [Syzygium oleosum]|uniref:uncharacterized protein LOC115687893 isoform X1 n=1 Tax=Syzygium oleosum TaxID=219896 RepID=UPI0024B8B77D|nr:uncharacterized protein LOC115687893 isoform X1 [Syzygium oleosum]